MDNSKVATFRLFVQHGRPLSSAEGERELRGLFEEFGLVISFATRRGEWRNSQVTFSSTAEAVKAKKELDKTRCFKDSVTLKIFFTKPSRRVLVRGLPDRVSFNDLEREFQGATFLAITFETISDAQTAVASGKVYQGRTLSFDFGNDRAPPRGREPSQSGERELEAQVLLETT